MVYAISRDQSRATDLLTKHIIKGFGARLMLAYNKTADWYEVLSFKEYKKLLRLEVDIRPVLYMRNR